MLSDLTKQLIALVLAEAGKGERKSFWWRKKKFRVSNSDIKTVTYNDRWFGKDTIIFEFRDGIKVELPKKLVVKFERDAQ